jgi:hypothetical protein
MAERLRRIARARPTLGEVLELLPTPVERMHVTALAYVLWRCNALQLAPRDSAGTGSSSR